MCMWIARGDDSAGSVDLQCLPDRCPYLHKSPSPELASASRLIGIEPHGDAAVLTISARTVADDVKHGASIAVNGTCLTVVAWGEGWWEADVVDESLRAFGAVDAPSTWVLSNHDQVRHATRLTLDPNADQGDRIHGVGPKTQPRPDEALGQRRARGASTFMLALPGGAYLYQGEELGLPEAIDIPDADRQDPTFWRTNGEAYGRDGCRVPIPWEADKPSYGFGPSNESWLPQPANYRQYSRDLQEGVSGSTLELYKTLLKLRRDNALGTGSLAWIETNNEGVLAFANNGIRVFFNMTDAPFALPDGEVLATSADVSSGSLPAAAAVWLR